MQLELTSEFIQEIKKAIREENDTFVHTKVAELHPTDIASLLKDLNDEGVKFILENISPELGSEAIADLDDDHLSKFLKFLPADRVS